MVLSAPLNRSNSLKPLADRSSFVPRKNGESIASLIMRYTKVTPEWYCLGYTVQAALSSQILHLDPAPDHALALERTVARKEDDESSDEFVDRKSKTFHSQQDFLTPAST
jgi:hypothetical protein